MYRVLDLFSGIGGFSLGLERTGGFKTVAFCEIEPFCRRVLAKHWPGVPCHEDVTTMQFSEGMADVITGGFPCQDISFAGKGAGLAGSRSGLWRELARAIRMVRPRYAILENVAALLSRGMGRVLGDLAEIGNDAEWHCIPASAVGAPHRRDRLWIVANPGSEQHEGHCAEIKGKISEGLPQAVADTFCVRELQQQGGVSDIWRWPSNGSTQLADAGKAGRADDQGRAAYGVMDRIEGLMRDGRGRGIGNQWGIEPAVGRVAHGVPARVDRLKSLGNAVVPQIPEMIGRAILEANP